MSKNFSTSFYFIVFVMSFMAGILTGALGGAVYLVSPFLIIALFLLLKHPMYVLIMIAAAVLGAASYNFHLDRFQSRLEQASAVTSFKVVVAEVEDRAYNTVYRVEDRGSGYSYLIKTGSDTGYVAGDMLAVDGNLLIPSPDGFFSYSNYLMSHSILGEIAEKNITVKGRSRDLLSRVRAVRHAVESKIAATFPEPQGSLLAGLLVGSRGGLRGEVLENFNRTGTTHIIAISGFNIAIIVSLVVALFRRKTFISFLLTVLVIFFFVFIAGATASVIRAAIMGSISVFGLNIIGRKKHAGAILFLAALVMLLQNPLALPFDLSFILSFLATFGLIYFAPSIAAKIKLPAKLSELVSIVIAANLATLPVVLAAFGKASLVALVANLMIAPLVPLAMLAGAVTLAAAVLSAALSAPLVIITNYVLKLVIAITKSLAGVPFAQVEIIFVPLFLLLGSILTASMLKAVYREEINNVY